MKLLTEEEKYHHFRAVLKGGILGGTLGLAFGSTAVLLASRRFPSFRRITPAWRGYFITSAGTFGGTLKRHCRVMLADVEATVVAVISADRTSHAVEAERHPDFEIQLQEERARREIDSSKTYFRRAVEWVDMHRYKLIFGSWAASLGAALWIVGRDGYLTRAQKVVQARVYAQGFTIGLILLSASMGRPRQIGKVDDFRFRRVLDVPVDSDASTPGLWKASQTASLKAHRPQHLEHHPQWYCHRDKLDQESHGYGQTLRDVRERRRLQGHA